MCEKMLVSSHAEYGVTAMQDGRMASLMPWGASEWHMTGCRHDARAKLSKEFFSLKNFEKLGGGGYDHSIKIKYDVLPIPWSSRSLLMNRSID